MRKVKLYTFWHEEKLECCCPPENKCLKDKGCELMTFSYNEYEDIKECMKARQYKRGRNGAIVQK